MRRGNSKSEGRNPKEARSPRFEAVSAALTAVLQLFLVRAFWVALHLRRRTVSEFGIRNSFGFRISAFGFNPLPLVFSVLALSLAGLAAEARDSILNWQKLPALPDPVGVAGPFAGVSGGALMVAGGANFPSGMPWEGGAKVWHDSIFVLPKPDGEWLSGFRLPRSNGYGVSITTSNGLVCIGGGDADEHFRDVLLLEWVDGRIVTRSLPELPRPNAFNSGALLGQTIYIAGGIETPGATGTLKTFWALDLSESDAQWRELEPWPGPGRMLAVAAVQDGAFFLASGVDLSPDHEGKPAREYLNDAYRYKPGAGWRRIADMPRPAVAAPSPAPAIGQTHFLVIGGDDGSLTGFQPIEEHPGFPSEILAYHTITDTWASERGFQAPSTLPGETTLKRPEGRAPSRVTVPVVLWHDRFVIPSGEVRPGVRSPEVWSATAAQHKSRFATLDYITLAAYLLGVVGIGCLCSRGHKTTDDFFLAGKRIPWWAAGISIFGTQLSAITFLAIPAKVYSEDWTYFLNNMMIIAVAPLVVFFFLPFYRRLNVTTVYEYLEHRFNLPTRLVASAAFCLLQIGRMGIVLFLPALALSAVTGINVYTCILLMGALATLYTVVGGIAAVIWTDFAQVIVLVLGALLSLFLVAANIEGGFAAIVATGWADGKFHMLNWDWDLTTTTVWVLVIGNLFAHLIPYSADQSVVQRYLTTRDETQAARSIWTNAVLVLPATLLFFTLGTALYVFFKTHPQALAPHLATDAVFAWFISHSLPVGIAGIVVAAVFAAAMSSLDSSMNSVATAVTTDFYRRFRPSVPDAACLKLARALTVLLGVIGTGTAIWMAGSDIKSLWDQFVKVLGLFGGSLGGLFLLGIFTRRANGTGALIGAITSALVLWWVQANTPLHFFLYAGVGMLTCVGIGYLASLALPGKSNTTGLTVHSLFNPSNSGKERKRGNAAEIPL